MIHHPFADSTRFELYARRWSTWSRAGTRGVAPDLSADLPSASARHAHPGQSGYKE